MIRDLAIVRSTPMHSAHPLATQRQFAMLGIVHYQNTMARQLKRWESPRKEGRNDKGKGGTARQRQVKKQMKMLRKRLQDQGGSGQPGNSPRGELTTLPIFLGNLR
jgi:hypothetical protein